MAVLSGLHIRKIFVSLFILSGLFPSLYSQDVKEISGKINVYRKVVEITSSNSVRLFSVDSVAAGDTIMLIQMQGIGVSYSDPPQYYGRIIEGKFGNPEGPGHYEILLVGGIVGDEVFFTREMKFTYDVLGNLQLIVIPSYYSAKITGKLTAKSWDSSSGTGGVLALSVGSTLEFDSQNGEIDVSGKGFRGGKDTIGLGDCIENNFTENYKYSYPWTWTNAGYKGEGAANFVDVNPIPFLQTWVTLFPNHSKGQGPAFTGGGGGNGRYSGGGGGANRGIGQEGGVEVNIGPGACPQNSGGFGGSVDLNPIYTDGIYLGGGGGASTHAPGEPSSNGGNGGGIVIIMADVIIGNGRSIKADGLSAASVSGNAGGGGGGAGGSILLSSRSISGSSGSGLTISAQGGSGGFRDSNWGSGGSGGGGLISLSQSQTNIPAYVGINVDAAPPTDGADDNNPAGDGEIAYNLIPEINGFLFNVIKSEQTGNQVDSTCSNIPFGRILGTKPFGGVGDYTFQWDSCGIRSIMDYKPKDADFVPIIGAVDTNYTPGSLSKTTWFRRVVKDGGTVQITDKSVPVKVIVHQAITGNTIGKDTTICNNQDPLPLGPRNSGPSNGNGIYSYIWLKSLNNTTVWDTTMKASGADFRKASYNPPALQDTNYYKRVVVSARCIDYSQATVKITVLPSISNNIINNPAPQSICQPATFANITGSNPSGGNGSYLFTWQQSLDKLQWQTAEGAGGQTNDPLNRQYDPMEDLTTESLFTRYIRRKVLSGPNNVCIDTTAFTTFIQYPKIKNNNISGPLCQTGTSNLILNGTPPSGGDGNYLTIWKSSFNQGTNYNDWTPVATTQNYDGPPPPDSLYYGRLVVSASGLCRDSTFFRDTILVHRIPVANAGPDAEICGATVKLKATMSTFGDKGVWTFPADVKYPSSSTNPETLVKVDSSFFNSSRNKPLDFWWKETNGRCHDSAKVKITFYTTVEDLGPDRDTALYSFDGILHMNADGLGHPGWEAGLWTTVSGSDDILDETKPDARVQNLSAGVNSYKWTVTNKNNNGNGTTVCTDSYMYYVTLYNIFVPNVFSPNGDGLYDVFQVQGVDLVNQRAELRILNSAGTEVYYTSNTNGSEWRDWDGTNAGGDMLPEGTYYYLLKLTSWGIDEKYDTSDDSIYKKSGFVVLRRYGQ